MDTTDAQVSLGSDGIIESHPNQTNTGESIPIAEKPTIITQSPVTNKSSVKILTLLSLSIDLNV